MRSKISLVIIIAGILGFAACKKDNNGTKILPNTSEVLYISNEGAFGFGNASLSVYYPKEDRLINQAFEQVNNRSLGDVLQSVYRYKDKIYCLVNASSKIEVAQANSLKELAVIKNVVMPRYMSNEENRAYVSCWGNKGEIVALDLSTNTIVKRIAVGNGPEHLLLNKQNLFVCNSGGFKTDSTLSIIDINNGILKKTLYVGDAPMDIVSMGDSIAFVLCRGKILYDASWNVIGHSSSKLVKISLIDFKILKSFPLFAKQHPAELVLSKDKQSVYIGGGYGFAGLYRFDLNREQMDSLPVSTKSFYGIAGDCHGNIYGFESPDFTSAGSMTIMNPQAVIIKVKTVGIGPNGMCY